MKKLYNFFKNRINNAGMSLVELLCAIAIMSIVGASVAGIMAVSANSYNRGSNDAEMQQTAQLLANQVNNLVQDAKEAEARTVTATSSALKIIKTDGTEINIIHSDADKTVTYSIGGESEVMAEDVAVFKCDTLYFSEDGIVRMYICISKNDNTYAGNYTATSRNIDINTTVVDGDLTMTFTHEYVLEPNQTYALSAEMSDGSGVDWALSGNTDTATVFGMDPTTGRKTLTIGPDEMSPQLTLTITSQARRTSDGVTPRIQKTASVFIRRVSDVNISFINKGTNDETKSLNAGTVYRLTANANGYHLENKGPSMPDTGYDSYLEEGTLVPGLYTRISDKNITWKLTFLHNGADATSEYVEMLSQDTSNGLSNTPFIEFRLKKTIDSGDQLIVVATSTHSKGFIENESGVKNNTNVTGVGYGEVIDYWWLYKSVYSYDDSNLSRGSDDSQGWFDALDILKNYVIPTRLTTENPGVDWNYYTRCHPVKYHRFREVSVLDDGTMSYGPWTNWRENKQNASDYDINVRPIVTQSLDCDKSYELQIRLEMVQNETGEKLWPFVDTPKSEYTIDAVVKPISVLFNLSDNSIYYAIGSDGVNLYPGQEYELRQVGATGIKSDLINGKLVWNIERYNEKTDEWVAVETCTDNNNNVKEVFWNTQNSSVRFGLHRKGTYRVTVSLRDIAYSYYVPRDDWYTMAGDTKNYDYFDLETGKGVFYFTINKNSNKYTPTTFEFDGKEYLVKDYFACDDKLYKKSEFAVVKKQSDQPVGAYAGYGSAGSTYYNYLYFTENGLDYTAYRLKKENGNIVVCDTNGNKLNNYPNDWRFTQALSEMNNRIQ